MFGQSADIAKVSASGDTIRWDITVPYSAATLTVSGPSCGVIRKEFKEGTSPSFTAYDNNGNKLPDGQYQYELRLTPVMSADTVKELAVARAKSGGQEADPDCRVRALQPSHPLVQSAGFSILRGAVIVAGGTEPNGRTAAAPAPRRSAVPEGSSAFMPARYTEEVAPRLAARMTGQPFAHPAFPDQVIPDDLIVQGSLCVGLDCVNNESFGFDTIRLKENNTRIKFDDTSVSAGFPANDWQLTANDSASGGSSKFSIEDITGSKVPFTITAGASTNSIFVDSTGRVGFRTSTPVLDLHVATSNTPAIRLEQNNSGGFTAQTWDIGANEANFFIRDVTGGSKLSFRIRPGAPTSSIDISADGDVGIGTASPHAKLEVKQATSDFVGGIQLRRDTTNDTWALVTGSDNNFYMGYATDASLADADADFTVFPLILTTSNRVGIGTAAPDQKLSVIGNASKSVGGTTWAVFSDERLKNIKGNFTSGLKAVMQLQPLRYEYKTDNALGLKSEGEQIGFGAQALQKVIPEAVTKTSSGYLMVNSDPILWTMLNAIKEQQKEIEQLKAQIQKLQPRNRARNRRR
ncbi:MAG TPA: tail fiber domain-containing protein [Pyrinomonadaceae bacterium]|nr:tail fiber domain-containing protein [Pyrinomonadaceae bacterium]